MCKHYESPDRHICLYTDTVSTNIILRLSSSNHIRFDISLNRKYVGGGLPSRGFLFILPLGKSVKNKFLFSMTACEETCTTLQDHYITPQPEIKMQKAIRLNVPCHINPTVTLRLNMKVRIEYDWVFQWTALNALNHVIQPFYYLICNAELGWLSKRHV